MSAQEMIKSLAMDGLHWLTQNAFIKSMAWLGFEFFVLLAIVCSLFHPILRGISRYVYLLQSGAFFIHFFSLTFLHYNTLSSICRGPLLTYLGMEYGDIKLSPSRLKLTILFHHNKH